jgi:hypothetical protein
LTVRRLIEAIHLVEQFEQNTLNFSIGTGLSVEPLGGDSVDFIDENDDWRIFSGQSKYVANLSWTFA